MRDGGGRLVQNFASYLDLTALREAQADLLAANAALEVRVAARTAALQMALDECEALLQEVHHRVKNSLQLAAAVLQLQARTATAEAGDGLRQAESRLLALARVHDLLHGSGDVQDIDLGHYMRALCRDLMLSAGVDPLRVAVHVDVEDIRWGPERIVPIGKIVNELVTNALKYAFPDGRAGAIRLSLARKDGKAHLAVSDDGVGLPTERDPAGSLGLRLVQAFAAQLGGAMTVAPGPGATFTIRFPE